MRPRSANTSVRPAAVAGLFYPEDPQELQAMVSDYLRHAPSPAGEAPRALIVPHAGYVYSGPIAAAAYASITSLRSTLRRIVLIGPSHRVYLRGMAVPSVDAFATPLGKVEIDREARERLRRRADVIVSDAPHASEHCLEVQLPFLQLLFEDFCLLPIVLGSASPQQVAAALEDVCADEGTLVLASSDLSHYHSYETARQIDAATSAAILRQSTALSGDQACGAVAINGLMQLAREHGMSVREIARCNSGDTAGDKARVVGYGAFAVHGPRSARSS